MKQNYSGYHTKFTADLHDEIIQSLRLGLTLRTTAKLVGIDHRTLNLWLSQGKRESDAGERTLFTHLLSEYNKTLGAQLVLLLDDVRNRRKNWQAAWELIKSLNREEFGQDALQFEWMSDKITQLTIEVTQLKKGILTHDETNNSDTQETSS